MFPDRTQPLIHHLRGTGASPPTSPYYKRPAPTIRRATDHSPSRRQVEEPARPRNIAFSQSSNLEPGSASWTVNLVVAALKADSNISVVKLAADALDALVYGDGLWREVDTLLGSHGAGGVPAAISILADRKAGIQPSASSDAAPPVWRGSDFPITIRPFQGKIGSKTITGNTTYILPPPQWPEGVHDGEPPKLDHAPVHCIFCMPREAPSAEDPWKLWILNSERRWQEIEQRSAHPDPKLHPYVLKVRADRTPSWVQPATVSRDDKRAERKKASSGPLSAVTLNPPATTTQRPARTHTHTHTTSTGLRYNIPTAGPSGSG